MLVAFASVITSETERIDGLYRANNKQKLHLLEARPYIFSSVMTKHESIIL